MVTRKRKTPTTTSKTTIIKENIKAYGSKKVKFRTSELKYSCSLYEKPKGSLSLTNPEIINKIATEIRKI